MEYRSGFQYLLSFALLYVFCSQTLALSSLGTYAAMRYDEQMPVKRHSDAVFTNNYSRLRKRIAVKKYLDSILTEEKRQKKPKPPSLQDETEWYDPAFSGDDDGVTIEDCELLRHLPLDL
ncbi:VIP peptides-like [Anolis carolinensis]|uniref:VIP peptides-like n=1 Tax=Anolis carolinensis TaxID=28377 RepID=UPI002F2B74AC